MCVCFQTKGQAASSGVAEPESDPGTWEVWVHEPCAIWAAGVHLVGPRMVGLQEAVWGAANSVSPDLCPNCYVIVNCCVCAGV